MPTRIVCPTEDAERLPELCRLLGVDVPKTFRDRVVLSDLVRNIFDEDDETWWRDRPLEWEVIQMIRETHNG